jgi:hypothetical protein
MYYHNFYCLIVLLIVVLGCTKHSNRLLITEEATVAPIWADETNEIQHNFELRNDTNKTLEILNISNTCTCSQVSVSSKMIPPKDKIDVKMTSDMRGRYGSFSASSLLELSNGQGREFQIKTEVYKHLEIEPNTFYFGKVTPGQKCSLDFQIIAHSKNDVIFNQETIKVKPNENRFQITLEQPLAVDLVDGIKKTAVAGKLNFTAPILVGEGNSSLEVSVTTEEGTFTDSAKIYWLVGGHYTVDPTSIFINANDIKDRKNFPIRITHEQNTPVVVSNVLFKEFEGDYIKPSNNDNEIVFSVKSVDLSQKYKAGSCIISIDDTEKTQIEIPVLFLGDREVKNNTIPK